MAAMKATRGRSSEKKAGDKKAREKKELKKVRKISLKQTKKQKKLEAKKEKNAKKATKANKEESDSDVADADQTQLRDRLKARKFRSIWSDLGDSVKQAYADAKGSGKGDSRERQTNLINQVIARRGNKFVFNPEAPILKEIKEREKKKFMQNLKGGDGGNERAQHYFHGNRPPWVGSTCWLLVSMCFPLGSCSVRWGSLGLSLGLIGFLWAPPWVALAPLGGCQSSPGGHWVRRSREAY